MPSDKKEDAQLVYWTRVLALLAALQFIALGVHAVFFSLQARALRATIVQSKDSEKRELRGYAGVASAHIVLPERGGMMNVYVEIQNFGRTPAYNASSAVYYDMRNLAAPPPEFFIAARDDRVSTSTIYPGRSLELKIDNVVSAEAADATYRGHNQIVVWGQVDYDDVFGKPHWTRFRLLAYRVPSQERFLLAGIKNENTET